MERTVVEFPSPEAFEAWLETHHTQETGVWLKLTKKGSDPGALTYAQALDCALCWGWIDGQKARFDETSWLQYFTKRRKRSVWSQINRIHIERLRQAGRMKPAGEAAVAEAQANGQWDAAYASSASRAVPEDFEAALNLRPQARAAFDALSSQNRFAFVFRVSSARKPETRQARIAEFLRMLENGETFYPAKKKESP